MAVYKLTIFAEVEADSAGDAVGRIEAAADAEARASAGAFQPIRLKSMDVREA